MEEEKKEDTDGKIHKIRDSVEREKKVMNLTVHRII